VSANTGTRRRLAPHAVPVAVAAAVVAAWLLALVADVGGGQALFNHDALAHSGRPLWAALGLFLLSWQVMIAAMMLPSSVPMVLLFGDVSAAQQRHGGVMAAFLGGYALVWSAFGAVAFLGDQVLHRVVDATPWLDERPWLIMGGVLVMAGAFQFSPLKERCLNECRHPAQFMFRRYRRGVGAAFRLGRGHGLFCLGCCWALMLVMFAAGVGDFSLMALLAVLMVSEKAGRRGPRVARLAGVALLAFGVLTVSLGAMSPR
jgi:predicted metal-binding membrane protein